MPRPKSAGKDPRFGRLSSRILDQILDEYDSGQRARLIRRIRRLQRKAIKLAEEDGGCESFGPNGPMGPPPALVMAQVAGQVAMAEEIISRIREREQKTEAAIIALMHGLEDRDSGGSEEKRGPVQIVVKYADGVKPGGDPSQ
jgi:hypothetical protein